jgi:hypothetical protein
VQVSVYQYRFAALQVIVSGFDVETNEAGMFQVFFACYFGFNGVWFAQCFYNGWRVGMVNQRIEAGEPFGRNQLFGI